MKTIGLKNSKRNLLSASLAVITSLIVLSSPAARAQQPPSVRPGHPYQAAAFEAMRLRNENGVIATNGLLNAIRQAQEMPYNANAWPGAAKPQTGGFRPLVADLNTNNWEWLGPGNVGGRIRAILIDPSAPSIMWIGSVGGGVWKTTNGAASFFPCDDWMNNLAIGCMALDPTDPNVLYAGTGEGFGNGDAIRGAGIFKSTDGGLTWTQLSSTSYATQNNINRLAICPTNHLVILAATGNGIWRSTNGGTNWTRTYSAASVKQVAFHPTDGSKALATPDGKVLYSTDAGLTWTAATGLGAGGRIEFAYAPSSPNIVYASQNINGGEIYMSTDGGATFTLRNTGTNYLQSQGWYDNCVWVDPTDPNNLVVGGIDLWRSTDGGSTLTKISDWAVNQANDALISAHADHHAIVSAPGFDGVNNTTVYFGNDGGFYAVTNIYTVTTTAGWTNLNHNLGITQFYGVAGNPTTFTVVGGAQDNGSSRFTPATGTEGWNFWYGGDGGFCAADPTNSNYFYGEYVDLQIYRSTDGGLTASYIDGGIGDAGVPAGYNDDDPNAPTSANFIAPFILDPNNPDTMLAGGSNLWRSVNVKASPASAVTWTNIKAGISSGSFISAIAVAPGDSDIIWVGYNDGSVFATANGTAASPTWAQKDLGSPNLPNRYCTRIAIDPTDSNVVYATFGGFSSDNVYRTTDGGATWANIASGLPAAPVYSIVIAPFNHNYLYVGTEVGVFGSADAGTTWSSANEGPANVQVLDLTWVRNYLVAGTHGRGAYWIALGPPTVVVTPASVTEYIGSNVTFTTSAIGTPPLTYQWQYDGSNIVGATGATLTLTNVQATNDGHYTVVVANGEGTATSAPASLTVVYPPPYFSQAVAGGPVAYWRLNEASGSTAYDSVGDYNGTNNGSLVLGVSGPTSPAFPGFESGNTAYQFNGSNTRISLPALNLNSTNFTITAWVRRSGSQGYYPGIVSWNGGTPIIQFGFGDNNNQLTYIRNGSVYGSSTLTTADGQWTFAALAVGPTTATIYMATNSALTSATFTRSDASATVFTNVAYIGYSPYGGFDYNGAIDEVAIYNQLLTPTQITNLVSSSQAALPAVTLTAPTDGGSFDHTASVNLAASVTPNGHSITKVQFYNGPNLLGESTASPYQYTWSGAPPGTYTLLAQAIYDGSNTNPSLPATITLTNSPPVATPMTVQRTAGLRLLIALSDVATNWSDADGDSVRLTGINSVSTNNVNLILLNVTTNNDGSYVITNTAYIGYTNSPNVDDQIGYSISDGFGGTNVGFINVAIAPSVTGTNSIASVAGGNPTTITAYGIPGDSYVMQRATNLAPAVWVNISTNTAAANGLITVTDDFSDLGGNPPSAAYYRLSWSH